MTDPDDVRLDVAAFDLVSPTAALELMRPVCAAPVWLDAIVARRPFGSLDRVIETSDSVIRSLAWTQVEKALAAHPRIGERATGADLESTWSRHEQSGAAAAADDVAARLHDGNVAYEQRFGYVFLVCATGLSAEQMLAALTERLGHDPAQEQTVVRRELGRIVALRLARTLV